MRKKKKKDIKILLLARNKSNSIENLTSKALIYNEISYGEFNTIMNKEKVWYTRGKCQNYKESKKWYRKKQTDKNSKRLDIDEIIF